MIVMRAAVLQPLITTKWTVVVTTMEACQLSVENYFINGGILSKQLFTHSVSPHLARHSEINKIISLSGHCSRLSILTASQWHLPSTDNWFVLTHVEHITDVCTYKTWNLIFAYVDTSSTGIPNLAIPLSSQAPKIILSSLWSSSSGLLKNANAVKSPDRAPSRGFRDSRCCFLAGPPASDFCPNLSSLPASVTNRVLFDSLQIWMNCHFYIIYRWAVNTV